MTVSVVFAVAGALALLFGIIGGGIKAKEIEVPLLSFKARIISIIVGVTLIGFTIWMEFSDKSPTTPASDLQTLSTASNDVENKPASTNTPTSENTQTTAPTPTLPSQGLDKLYSKLYEAKTWNLVLEDSFDQNEANWTLWNVDDNEKHETMEINNGVLSWGLRLKAQNLSFNEIAPVFSYSDFYYSVKARRIGESLGENQATWGLIFRRQGQEFYSFQINDIQEYSIHIHDEQGWKDVLGVTRSPFVEPNKFNELTVIADGPALYFFINGTPIGMINDNTYSYGNVGLLAGLNFVASDDVYFEFDDFELRQKSE